MKTNVSFFVGCVDSTEAEIEADAQLAIFGIISCAQFVGSGYCTDDLYTSIAKQHCPVSCSLCAHPSSTSSPTLSPTTNPTEESDGNKQTAQHY
jgi:hypothetical protein